MINDNAAGVPAASGRALHHRPFAEIPHAALHQIVSSFGSNARDIRHLLDASNALLLDRYEQGQDNDALFDMTLAIIGAAARLAAESVERANEVL